MFEQSNKGSLFVCTLPNGETDYHLVETIMQILDRNEMRKIMAGSSGGCAPSCGGCSKDATSHGACVKWVCVDNNHCVPKTDDCCIITE
jgi:hypothetical protein